MTIRTYTKSTVLQGKPDRNYTKFFKNQKIKVFHLLVEEDGISKFLGLGIRHRLRIGIAAPGLPLWLYWPNHDYQQISTRHSGASKALTINDLHIYNNQYVKYEYKNNPSKYELVDKFIKDLKNEYLSEPLGFGS